jgi:hypothetical protein
MTYFPFYLLTFSSYLILYLYYKSVPHFLGRRGREEAERFTRESRRERVSATDCQVGGVVVE